MSKYFADNDIDIRELIDAAVNQPSKAARLIASKPELVDARYVNGDTCLHFLAVEGYDDGVRLLASLGVDVNATNKFGDPPILDVVRLGNHKMTKLLLQLGADTTYESETYGTLLDVARDEVGDQELVNLLQKFGAK